MMIIVCDSIRVREGSDDKGNEVATTVEEAPRCPLCSIEFHDPTVVVSSCGHGMHLSCWEAHHQKAETRRELNPMYACPLCRGPFRMQDVVLLRGVLPSTSKASEWRTVQMTGLWKASVGDERGSDEGSKYFCEQVESLYVHVKAAFRTANDLSYAIGGALQRFESAINAQLQVADLVEKETTRLSTMEMNVKKQLELKRRNLVEREKRLLTSEFQNSTFVMKYVTAIRREDWNRLKTMGSTARLQNKLESTLNELTRTQERIETARRNLQMEYDQHSGEVMVEARAQNKLDTGEEAGPSMINDADSTRANCHIDVDGEADRITQHENVEVIGIEDSSNSEQKDDANDSRSLMTASVNERTTKRVRRNYRLE